MSTATAQQIGQDFHTWLGIVAKGETVAILQDGRIVARLTPAAVEPASAAPRRSMEDWRMRQNRRLKTIFGDRILPDSAAVLDELRTERT